MAAAPVSRADQKAFEAWLEASPRNLADYEALRAVLREADGHESAFRGEIDAIMRRKPARPSGRASAGPWKMWAGLAMGGLAAAAAAFAVLQPPRASAPAIQVAEIYATAKGEVRDIVLADGSKVTLNTDTRLSVAMDAGLRRVELAQGEAFFDVTHDPVRAFRVAVGERDVVVTGTEFITTLLGDQARVSVLEGSVGVTFARAGEVRPGAEQMLTVGSAAAYGPGQPLRLETGLDVAALGAWRRRQLVFQDATLGEAFETIERYVDADIVLADDVASRRVTAIIPLNGPGDLIDRVDALFPVAVARRADGGVDVTAE
jgi:transmembrane sensor